MHIPAEDGRAEYLRQILAADWKMIVAARNTGAGTSAMLMFIPVQSGLRSKPDFPGLQSNATGGMVNPHGRVVQTSSRSPNAGRPLKMETRLTP
jgi:hypothetical protein